MFSNYAAFTTSDDATSNNNINFHAMHGTWLAESYDNPTPTSPNEIIPPTRTHQTRVIGVQSTVDHTAKTQVEIWENIVSQLTTGFNASPLAQRLKKSLSTKDIKRKWRGFNGDHAADFVKKARLIGELKLEVILQDLGYEVLASLSDEDRTASEENLMADEIDEAGGLDAWKVLPDEEKMERLRAAQDVLAVTLGSDAWEDMSVDQQQQELAWNVGGCCMHKGMNIAKAASDSMHTRWLALKAADPSVQTPIPQPNKYQRIFASSKSSSDSSSAPSSQKRNDSQPTSGAIRTIFNVGQLANHKDSKLGYQDEHRFVMAEKKAASGEKRILLKFPDVCNTRYGSYLFGSVELLAWRQETIEFLEFVRDGKEKMGFNRPSGKPSRSNYCKSTIILKHSNNFQYLSNEQLA